MEGEMKTITFSVADEAETKRRLLAAFAGKKQGHHMSFASVELMWQTLTQKRWQIIQLMTGQEAMSLREIARRAERDVKAVHGDVHALIAAGVIDRTADGKFVFPYDAVRVEFTLRKVA
jgi:predicted transcriptional regulator